MKFITSNHKYKLRRLVLNAVVFTFLSTICEAHSIQQCLKLFNEDATNPTYSIDPAFTKRQVSLIRGVVGRLQKLASSVRVPNPDIEKRSENVFQSGYQALANKIFMGMSMDNFYLRKAIVVLAPEFGHAIFDLNIFFLFQGQKVNAIQGAKMIEEFRQRILSSAEYKVAVAEINEKFKRFDPEKRELEAEIVFRKMGG